MKRIDYLVSIWYSVNMVLTPDQKKRLAELDVEALDEEKREEPSGQAVRSLLVRLKMFWSSQISRSRSVIGKGLLLLVLVGVAGYFVKEYQLYRTDFRSAFSSGSGNPVENLWNALKLQKQKAGMVDVGRSQFLVGDYKEALATASAVLALDSKDRRAQDLINLVTDAATQRADREFDLGEIETALSDVRLALKYQPEDKDAQDLYSRIGERLFREAQSHYNKQEYAQLITKAQEVIRINPSHMDASNLLMRTNNELLTRADELFINKRYFDALENVNLSLKIDPANSRALRLLAQISLYVETPNLRLRGITIFGKTPYAVIQTPTSNQPAYVKKGDTIRNFRVLDIDPAARTVKFFQIYTKVEFTVGMSKPE